MQGLMETWCNTLRNLRTCPARRMDRHLYVYIKQRLNQPQTLDALAQAIFERLRAMPRQQLARSPKRRFFVIAARALRELQTAASDTHAVCNTQSPNSHDDNLRQHLQHALAQLPAVHAAVLIARKRDRLSFAEIGATLGLPRELAATYCAQARAMIRTTPWNS